MNITIPLNKDDASNIPNEFYQENEQSISGSNESTDMLATQKIKENVPYSQDYHFHRQSDCDQSTLHNDKHDNFSSHSSTFPGNCIIQSIDQQNVDKSSQQYFASPLASSQAFSYDEHGLSSQQQCDNLPPADYNTTITQSGTNSISFLNKSLNYSPFITTNTQMFDFGNDISVTQSEHSQNQEITDHYSNTYDLNELYNVQTDSNLHRSTSLRKEFLIEHQSFSEDLPQKPE